MSKPSYGRSFFGNVTQRLQNVLNLEGTLPIDLGKEIVPVVVVADGTLPGYAGAKLRRFGAAQQGAAPAVSNQYYFKATEPIIVTSVQVSASAAGTSFGLYYNGPDIADVTPVVGNTSRMLDGNLGDSEVAPMATQLAVNFPEPTGNFYRSRTNGAASPASVGPFLLVAGSKLIVYFGNTSSNECAIFGMVL